MNHKDNLGDGTGGKQEYFDLTGTKDTRKEMAFNAYVRMYHDRVAPALAAAYKEHLATAVHPKSLTGFRSHWLSQALREEPAEIQEAVEAGRQDPSQREKLSVNWVDKDECDEAELERRAIAYTLYQ